MGMRRPHRALRPLRGRGRRCSPVLTHFYRNLNDVLNLVLHARRPGRNQPPPSRLPSNHDLIYVLFFHQYKSFLATARRETLSSANPATSQPLRCSDSLKGRIDLRNTDTRLFDAQNKIKLLKLKRILWQIPAVLSSILASTVARFPLGRRN